MMARRPRSSWLDRLCLLPFIALLAGALVDDDWLTNTGIGKTVWFYAAMAFVPPAAILSFWKNRQRVRFHLVDFFAAVWLSIVFLQAFLSSEIVPNSLATLGLLGVLYGCFRVFLVQKPSNIHVLMLAAMAVACAEAAWGILQLYGFARSQHALYPTTGSFFNPGPYAGFLATLLPVSVFYLLRSGQIPADPNHKIGRAVALAAGIATVLVLPATMSRAAWMAAAMGCAVVFLGNYAYFYGRKPNIPQKVRKKIGMAAVLLAVLAAALFGLYGLKKDSADGRALIWKISAELALRNPTGVGLGNFAGSYGAAQEAYFASGRGSEREARLAGEPKYAFNEFVQIGLEQGLPALLLFVLVVASAGAGGVRNGKLAAVGGLFALLVFAFFSYPFSLVPFLVLLVFFVAGCVSVPGGVGVPRTTVAVLLLSTVCVAGVLYARYPVFKAHQIWSQSRPHYRSGMYERVVKDYGPIAERMKDQPAFLFEHGRSLFLLHRYEESIAALQQGRAASADPMFSVLIGRCQQAMGDHKNAERSYRFAAHQVPNRLYPLYLLAKLYDGTGEREKARAMAAEVVRKEPKVHSPAVDEMKAEMEKILREGNKQSK